MTTDAGEPAFVDEHRISIPAARDNVWTALHRYVDSSLVRNKSQPLVLLLGTRPPAGFELSQEIPEEQLSLTGRHRFSRYRLTFELADLATGDTMVTARTYADFPGPHGRVYRAVVMGSGAHVVAVRAMLRSIRRLSLS
ncbi:MAG: hypothetical protein WAK18_07115 [Nocardioidaceae bacterium]